MSELRPPGERLDSWKAVADYLQRDVATVARWEKDIGLPIHRVGGTGRSVFAYTSEINTWLQTARPASAVPKETPVPGASERPAPGERLDSWKAVAEYLQRDVATAARWEKGLGLPIHRVGGIGRSVFAYTSEIDEWLQTAKPALAVPEETPVQRALLGDAPGSRNRGQDGALTRPVP